MTTADDNQRVDVLPGNNVFVFPDNMSSANINAAKECHVFANQAATAEFHPVRETEQWFEMYMQVMQQCGWLPISYELIQVSERNLKLDLSNLLGKGLKAAAAFAAGGLGAEAVALDMGKAVVETLASSEAAVELFNRESSENDRTGLSVAQCHQAENGEVVMLLSAVQTDGMPKVDANYLLVEWSSSGTSNSTASAALTFHRSLYEANKDILVERVHANARSTLLSLKLKR